MARKVKRHEGETIIALTRAEALEMIGLLAAQLADRAFTNNQAGMCPTLLVSDERHIVRERFSFMLDEKERM